MKTGTGTRAAATGKGRTGMRMESRPIKPHRRHHKRRIKQLYIFSSRKKDDSLYLIFSSKKKGCRKCSWRQQEECYGVKFSAFSAGLHDDHLEDDGVSAR